MALPDTRRGLEAMGYEYEGESRCRGCDCVLLWFKTPKDKKMPMEIVAGTEDDEEQTLACHFTRCPQGDAFRKRKENTRAAAAPNLANKLADLILDFEEQRHRTDKNSRVKQWSDIVALAWKIRKT